MGSEKGTLWLVKSNGNILGPYVAQKVADLLRDRVIVPLDEVSKPCERWVYIRDVATFAKVVEELRNRSMRGLSDETTTRGSDPNNTMNTTAVVHENTDELTVEIAQSPNQVVQDIMFHSIEDQVKANTQGVSTLYTHGRDKLVRRQVHDSSRWLWAITAVVLLVAASYVGFRQFVARPIQNKAVVDESVSRGMEALEEGRYDKALEHFDRAYKVDPKDSSLYLYLGILKTQIEGQHYLGRQLLEKLREKNDKDLKKVLVGIGLSYLKEEDSKNAAASFNLALDMDPVFAPAVIDLGAAALYDEDWAKASNQLLLAIKDGSTDGAEAIMLIESMARLYFKEKDKRFLVDGLRYLGDFTKKTRAYHLEALIGMVYLESLLGEKSKIYQKIDALLDMDFSETENFKQNLLIHRGKANWSMVTQWCLKLTQGLDPTARVIAFEGLCLLKSGDIVEANRKIEDAISQSPKDPLVLATYGYILREMNSTMDRAQVAIEKAVANDSDKKFIQPLRLQANLCQSRNDVECSGKIWKEILNANPQSLDALAGLSRYYLDKRQYNEAKSYLSKGLKISENYRPFFSLSRALATAEDRENSRGL